MADSVPDSGDRPDFLAQINKVAGSGPVQDDVKAKLEEKRLFGEAARRERYQAATHWVIVAGVGMIGIAVVIVLTVRIIHLVLSPSKQWLSAEQIAEIDRFMFSGTMGGVLTSVVRKLQKNHSAPDSPDESQDD